LTAFEKEAAFYYALGVLLLLARGRRVVAAVQRHNFHLLRLPGVDESQTAPESERKVSARGEGPEGGLGGLSVLGLVGGGKTEKEVKWWKGGKKKVDWLVKKEGGKRKVWKGESEAERTGKPASVKAKKKKKRKRLKKEAREEERQAHLNSNLKLKK
jgi:hypothetical protein